MQKIAGVFLLVVAAACSRSETVTTDTAQSSTGVTASATATTDTVTPGTSSVTPTATETVAPAPPANVATAPGTPSATRVVPASRRPATKTTTGGGQAPSPVRTGEAPVLHETATPAPVTETVPPHPSTTSDAAPAPTGEVAEGQAIFRSKCTGCHGADGRKPANGHVLASAEVRAKSDAELTRILHEGAGKISAMAHKRAALSDAQIKAVVAYIKAMQ